MIALLTTASLSPRHARSLALSVIVFIRTARPYLANDPDFYLFSSHNACRLAQSSDSGRCQHSQALQIEFHKGARQLLTDAYRGLMFHTRWCAIRVSPKGTLSLAVNKLLQYHLQVS
jgi:hypothetical protein